MLFGKEINYVRPNLWGPLVFSLRKMLNLATKYNKSVLHQWSKSHIVFWLLSYSASQRWLCTVDKMVKKKKLLKDILFYYVGGGVVVYYSRYIFLLCYLYYFIMLNAKIKLLILGVL